MREKIHFACIIIAIVVFGISCVEIESEVSNNAAYCGDQLAIIGYLSNKGAIVNVQKTVPPTNDGNSSSAVTNAKVILRSTDDQTFSVELSSTDNQNYSTPADFLPQYNKFYYITVSANGLASINSTPQKLLNDVLIDTVKISIRAITYSNFDTVKVALFGKPREINLEMSFKNWEQISRSKCSSRFIYFNETKPFEHVNLDEWREYNKPLFHYKIFDFNVSNYMPGSGSNIFVVRDNWGYDQIRTTKMFEYKGVQWPIVERMDSVMIQLFSYSADFCDFYTNTNAYMESATSPFSALTEKVPSNISNGIGYFGNINIAQRIIAIPQNANDSLNIYQPTK